MFINFVYVHKIQCLVRIWRLVQQRIGFKGLVDLCARAVLSAPLSYNI